MFLERGGQTTEGLADEAAGLQVGVLDVKVLEYLGVGVLLVYLNIEILDICNAEV